MLNRLGLEYLLNGNALSFVFQPIFDVTGYGLRTFAFESLTRGPEGTNFANPSVLFDYFRLKRVTERGDRRCIAASLVEVSALPVASRIAFNVHPATLERKNDFVPWLIREAEGSGIHPSRLIVEIVEHSQSFNYADVRWSVSAFHEMGISVALDDVGCGYSNHRLIVELQPALLKLDGFFVRKCETDPRRRAVMRSLQTLAGDLGARIIAEGVESEEELKTVQAAGIGLAQGFWLARPFSIRELAPIAPELCYA